MSNEVTERPLRIERLESRSLLAAGVFEFLAERDNHDYSRNSMDFHDKLDRPNVIAVNTGLGAHFDSNNSRAERSSIREQDRFGRNLDQPALSNDRVFSNRDIELSRDNFAGREPILIREQITTHVSLTNNNAPSVTVPPVDARAESNVNTNLFVRPVATIVVVIDERPSTSLISFRTDLPQSTPTGANAVSVSQVSPSTQRASDTLVQKTEPGVESGTPDDTSAIQQTQSQDDKRLQTRDNAPASLTKLHFGTASASTQDEYIELLPLWQTDPLQSKTETKEWKIDSNIAPQIRNALQSPLYRAPELADLVMQDWFAGPGGLIDLEHGSSAALFLPVPSELIHVELESIVGLHRSLGLIAACINEPISGPMLDAILSSIEDITSSENQPVSEAAPSRVPTFAYPALAVIASGVTIAAHRRRNHLHHPEAKDADE